MHEQPPVDRGSTGSFVGWPTIVVAAHTFFIFPALCAVAWSFGLGSGGPPGTAGRLLAIFSLTGLFCAPIHGACLLIPKSKEGRALGTGILLLVDAFVLHLLYTLGQVLAHV
ncbi:MAG: hypothetical protein JWN70_918 [Planctomycetaceae bacterium]|nr:hypothetical protein [Planctomycetaceae bacterium]